MISAEGLTKYYGDTCAVHDLTFEIQSGEIVGILGLNGAGKTTTLRILSCLLLPSTGRVRIDGLDVAESPHEIRKKVGFLPEVPPLYTEMSVEAFLVFAGELRGMSRRDAQSRLEEVLEVTHTREVRSSIIATLSHGYRQRVGIAQAIIHQPPVLILDEPISGLDPVQIVDMREMIRGLGGRHTVLVSSHILPEISQTCDRIMVIHGGEIVATGTEEELTSQVAVGGARHLRLLVRGEGEAVAARIRAVPGVAGCTLARPAPTLAPRGESAEKLHQLDVRCESDLREALAKEIVGGGFGLLHLAPAEAELESIFIQLTQKKEVTP